VVDFLVDTGTAYSAITEKEATIMGVDCSSLPYFRREVVGFGGLFRNRVINRQVILTFKSNED
jgi:predicted aspartyl protease